MAIVCFSVLIFFAMIFLLSAEHLSASGGVPASKILSVGSPLLFKSLDNSAYLRHYKRLSWLIIIEN